MHLTDDKVEVTVDARVINERQNKGVKAILRNFGVKTVTHNKWEIQSLDPQLAFVSLQSIKNPEGKPYLILQSKSVLLFGNVCGYTLGSLQFDSVDLVKDA